MAKTPRSLQQELQQSKPFASKRQEALLAIWRTADMLHRRMAEAVEPHGITPQQYNVLRILRGAGKAGLPTLDIADRMVEQTPGITRLLDRLEAKQLVRRLRCKEDRRQVLCFISDEGLRLLDELEPVIARADEEILGAVPAKDVAQLVAILEKIRGQCQ